MSIIRVNKTKDYTVMANHHLKERRMSLKAKGLLSLMLSLPDEWQYSIAGLATLSKDNKTAVKATLNELKEFGYLKITKLMPNKNENRARITYVYDIFESPKMASEQETKNASQEGKKQELENLYLASETLDKQGMLQKATTSQEGKKQELENLALENLALENLTLLNTKRVITNRTNTKKEIEKEIYKEKEKERDESNDHFLQNDQVTSKAIKEKKSENSFKAEGNKKTPRVTEEQLREEFKEVWDLYPRKQGRKVAYAAFVRARKKNTPLKEIREGIKQYAKYIKDKKISQEFIKQGSTFFNQNAWEDEWNTEETRNSYQGISFLDYEEMTAEEQKERDREELRQFLLDD